MDHEAPGRPGSSPQGEAGEAASEVAAATDVAAAGAVAAGAAADGSAADAAAKSLRGQLATFKLPAFFTSINPRSLAWVAIVVGALFLVSLGITFFVGSQSQIAPEAGVVEEAGSAGDGWGVSGGPDSGESDDGDVPGADAGARNGESEAEVAPLTTGGEAEVVFENDAGEAEAGFPEGGDGDGSGGIALGPDPAGFFDEATEDDAGMDEARSVAAPRGDEPLLAIVIDDWGYGWQAARDFLDFDRPLTVAVLPHLPLSRSQADEAHARGHQVILHLPMEPLAEQWDLGQGAVTTVMTSEEIHVDVQEALAAVPHVSGVNNHMGSKATADSRVVADVLAAVKSTGLFFLDSRTTAASVVPAVAREMGVPVLVNDRFIDPDTDPQRVKERILLAARLAKRRGYAVAIGHVRPETYAGLVASLEELDREGVRLAYLWEILERVYPEGAPE